MANKLTNYAWRSFDYLKFCVSIEIQNDSISMEKIRRKRNFLFTALLLTTLPFGLSSCGRGTKKRNLFVPGVFESFDSSSEGVKCEFFVAEINSEQYLSSNCQNVVRDLLTSKYYALELYVTDSDGTRTKYDIGKLVDYYEGVHTHPILYTDGHIDIMPVKSIWKGGSEIESKEGDHCYNIWIYESDRYEPLYFFWFGHERKIIYV